MTRVYDSYASDYPRDTRANDKQRDNQCRRRYAERGWLPDSERQRGGVRTLAVKLALPFVSEYLEWFARKSFAKVKRGKHKL
jgi:hypothetical protein